MPSQQSVISSRQVSRLCCQWRSRGNSVVAFQYQLPLAPKVSWRADLLFHDELAPNFSPLMCTRGIDSRQQHLSTRLLMASWFDKFRNSADSPDVAVYKSLRAAG